MNLISYSLAAIAKHGYLVLFAWVTAEQLGAPLPAVPTLIAAGVLPRRGGFPWRMHWRLAFWGA